MAIIIDIVEGIKSGAGKFCRHSPHLAKRTHRRLKISMFQGYANALERRFCWIEPQEYRLAESHPFHPCRRAAKESTMQRRNDHAG